MEEFTGIVNNFIDEEIEAYSTMNDRMKLLIRVVCLCTVEGMDEIVDLIQSAPDDYKPDIKEALLHCTPYIGSPKVTKVMKHFDFNGSYDQKTLVQRFDSGKEVRGKIFGVEATNKNVDEAREDIRHIQNYLCSYCFGDFYTRDRIDLKERELLTFCILSSLGGCESQVKSHVKGNLNVGNTRQDLIEAITLCLPYIGFPRTLNAIACINEIAA